MNFQGLMKGVTIRAIQNKLKHDFRLPTHQAANKPVLTEAKMENAYLIFDEVQSLQIRVLEKSRVLILI